jgi:hypothetical protein
MLKIMRATVSLMLLVCCIGASAAEVDMPACEAMAPGGAEAVELGLVQPGAAPEVLDYAVRLARVSEGVTVCGERWATVLPRWVPWSAAVERGYAYGLFVLAFLIAVGLAWRFTPRTWWDKPNLLAALFLGSVTWLGGILLLAGFHLAGGQGLVYGTLVSVRAANEAVPQWLDVKTARELELALSDRSLLKLAPPQQAQMAGTTPIPELQPQPAGKFRVHQRLNLREAVGVDSMRLAVLSAGDEVEYAGERQGDWWRIKTAAGVTGWVSSLWLRQSTEGVADAAKS